MLYKTNYFLLKLSYFGFKVSLNSIWLNYNEVNYLKLTEKKEFLLNKYKFEHGVYLHFYVI